MQAESWMEPETFSGICYHGTCINKNTESVFEELKEEYSDFDAIWVTPDEDVAEIFAKDNRRNVENPVILVFKLKVQLESMAVVLDNEYWRDFMSNYECDYDLRDCIPVLRNMGFDSWYTAGAVDQTFYDDIAIFGYGTKAFISHVKFLGPSGHWSSYIPIEKAIQEDFFKTTDPVYQTIKDEIIEQGQLSEETVKALYKKIIGILIRQFKDQLSEEERHDVAVDSVSELPKAKALGLPASLNNAYNYD